MQIPSLINQLTGETLVFPYLIAITDLREDSLENTKLLTFNYNFTIDEKDLVNVHKSRQVQLFDFVIKLEPAKFNWIKSFDHIPNPSVKGGIVSIEIENKKVEECKSLLKTDISFLNASYSAVTEFYYEKAVIASCNFDNYFQQRFGLVKSNFEKVELLNKYIRQKITDVGSCSKVFDDFLFNKIRIEKDNTSINFVLVDNLEYTSYIFKLQERNEVKTIKAMRIKNES